MYKLIKTEDIQYQKIHTQKIINYKGNKNYQQTIKINVESILKTINKLFCIRTPMSYIGYNSYEENGSQNENYHLEQQSFSSHSSNEQQNCQNLTYEQSSKVLHYDILADITNKINISQAINQQKKSSPFFNIQFEFPQPNIKTQIQQALPIKLNLKTPQPQLKKKTKAASLLYFQQKLTNTQSKNQQIKIKKQINTKPNFKQIDLLLQQKQQKFNYSIIKNRSKSNISISPTKYFPKNQTNRNQSNKQQILLTSRSGYVFSISQCFVENLTKQNNQPSFCEQQISLKQKIKRKISQDKKNQSRKLKTQADYNLKNICKKSYTKYYKPLQQNQATSSRAILSTSPFHVRQNKTLQNKKNTVLNLREQKDRTQLKQCTFKPKTNDFKKFKRL